jgi:hypothetical protein
MFFSGSSLQHMKIKYQVAFHFTNLRRYYTEISDLKLLSFYISMIFRVHSEAFRSIPQTLHITAQFLTIYPQWFRGFYVLFLINHITAQFFTHFTHRDLDSIAFSIPFCAIKVNTYFRTFYDILHQVLRHDGCQYDFWIFYLDVT